MHITILLTLSISLGKQSFQYVSDEMRTYTLSHQGQTSIILLVFTKVLNFFSCTYTRNDLDTKQGENLLLGTFVDYHIKPLKLEKRTIENIN